MDREHRYVEKTWEAVLVIAGFTLAGAGLLWAATVLLTSEEIMRRAMPPLLVAWVGVFLFSIVELRASKRVLGAYYPISQPLALLRLQVRFIGRAPREAAEKLGLPKALARILTFAAVIGFFGLFIGIFAGAAGR